MINISGAPPNLAGGPLPPPYYDNYSGPANPTCFLTLDAPNDWAGQSFTTTFKYNLEHVDLWLKKGPGANVGTITVELYAVDGNGHPTGAPLNYGVISDADILEDYSWVSCILDNGKLTYYLLDAATKYCIVIHGGMSLFENSLFWACGGDGSGYPNGDQEWSVNEGDIWSTDTTRDQLFRCFAPDFLDNYSGTIVPFLATFLDSQDDWASQSFTAMKSYKLNRVDMWFGKCQGGNVANIIVALYNVDGNGYPDIAGGALATGVIPNADVPEIPDYAWVRCDLSEFNVVFDTKYCIVVHGLGLSKSNSLIWSHDNYLGGNDYADGDKQFSANGGVAWSTDTCNDFLFRVYSA